MLTGLLLVPLAGSLWGLVGSARRESTREKVADTIAAKILRRKTLTLDEAATIEEVSIDWSQNPPVVRTGDAGQRSGPFPHPSRWPPYRPI